MGLSGSVRYLMLIPVLLLLQCSSNKPSVTSKPTRSLANPDSDLLEVSAVVFHSSDSLSDLYLQINNSNLLYRRPDTSKAFYAEVKVNYKLINEKTPKKISDSSSVFLIDRAPNDGITAKRLYCSFRVRANRSSNYLLELDVTDVNRRTKYSKPVNIYKESRGSAQNFLVKKNDTIAFQNSFLANEQINISYPFDVSFVKVECFGKEFGPALPPFSSKAPDELKYKPDSSFSVLVHNGEFSLNMPSKGFYQVKADADKLEGLTLQTVESTYPGVGTSLEMIQCTRYIMFKEEYEKCRDAVDKKAAIDEFWLNIGGSQERAKELLKRYYGRVKEANKMYSSYTQGWKTDRGMIFIVMGPPASVFRNKKNEVWVYGNDANPNALRFVFNKTENPFSDNDFIMERSVLYKEFYHTAVEYWRQGLVYFDNNRR